MLGDGVTVATEHLDHAVGTRQMSCTDDDQIVSAVLQERFDLRQPFAVSGHQHGTVKFGVVAELLLHLCRKPCGVAASPGLDHLIDLGGQGFCFAEAGHQIP